MREDQLNFTYIGGPTALLELDGLRLLTDPTFDPAGEEYSPRVNTLRKTASPVLSTETIECELEEESPDNSLQQTDYRL